VTDIAADKADLRSTVRASRRARTASERELAATGLAKIVTKITGYPEAQTFTAYAAFGTEPGTAALLSVLVAAGKRVLLPAVHDDGTLGWIEYLGPQTLVPSERGIPEPVGPELGRGAAALEAADVDIMLVPALAVDHSGARIGKGGGFYDRVLRDLPEDRPLRVAVVHDEDVLPAGGVPAQDHDQRVHAALTPTKLINF
jgi:5-formyltetrahydrofolate cyclo-ligase